MTVHDSPSLDAGEGKVPSLHERCLACDAVIDTTEFAFPAYCAWCSEHRFPKRWTKHHARREAFDEAKRTVADLRQAVLTEWEAGGRDHRDAVFNQAQLIAFDAVTKALEAKAGGDNGF